MLSSEPPAISPLPSPPHPPHLQHRSNCNPIRSTPAHALTSQPPRPRPHPHFHSRTQSCSLSLFPFVLDYHTTKQARHPRSHHRSPVHQDETRQDGGDRIEPSFSTPPTNLISSCGLSIYLCPPSVQPAKKNVTPCPNFLIPIPILIPLTAYPAVPCSRAAAQSGARCCAHSSSPHPPPDPPWPGPHTGRPRP